jgi:hypothetical protein
VVNRQWFEVFERMHWLCFHLEFEHGEHDPDEACTDPSCPMAATLHNYLGDIGSELREQAMAARAHAREHRDDGFAQGVAHGYYVVLSLLLLQAEAFQVPPATLGLDGLDADRDLL